MGVSAIHLLLHNNLSTLKKYIQLFWEAVKGTETNYTEISVRRALFMLAIPVILEMSMESLFAIVDAFFIGQIGSAEALATIGITDSFLFVVFALAMGISMAATAVVARRIGEKDRDGASAAAFQAILITIFFSVIIGFIGCLLYTSPSPRDRTRSRMPSSA